MLLWAKHINGTGFLAFVACQRQLTACKEHVAVDKYIQCLKFRQSFNLVLKSNQHSEYFPIFEILIGHFAIMFRTKTEVDDSLDFKHCMLKINA